MINAGWVPSQPTPQPAVGGFNIYDYGFGTFTIGGMTAMIVGLSTALPIIVSLPVSIVAVIAGLKLMRWYTTRTLPRLQWDTSTSRPPGRRSDSRRRSRRSPMAGGVTGD